MAAATQPEDNAFGVEALMQKYAAFVDSMDEGKRRGYAIAWSLLAIVLATAASLPLGDSLRWLSALVGSPAGIIVFLLVWALVHTTSLRESSVGRFREIFPPRRRVVIIIAILIVVATIFVAVGPFLPLGVGGAAVVAIALAAYNGIRRTPQELAWANEGEIDPREIADGQE